MPHQKKTYQHRGDYSQTPSLTGGGPKVGALPVQLVKHKCSSLMGLCAGIKISCHTGITSDDRRECRLL
ncbi:hypothetical protein NQZ68_028023 [Dissostichus eleginoides]|nr:hypothetical protein NQZ68_028023 [Dissostichus eleginoides]